MYQTRRRMLRGVISDKCMGTSVNVARVHFWDVSHADKPRSGMFESVLTNHEILRHLKNCIPVWWFRFVLFFSCIKSKNPKSFTCFRGVEETLSQIQ